MLFNDTKQRRGLVRYRCKPNRLAFVVAALLPAVASAQSAEAPAVSMLAFNSDFLQTSSSSEPVDLSTMLRDGNAVPPGLYRIDINVNGTLVGRRDVRFAEVAMSGLVKPCLTAEMLDSFGIDLGSPESAGQIDRREPSRCYELEKLFDQAKVAYDSGRLRLNISVPQANMTQGMRGYVNPDLWEQGVAGGYLNYQLNSRQESRRGDSGNSTFIGLQGGVNVGPWRLRNESSLSKDEGRPWNYMSNRTFAQRDISSLRSQLSIGELYTTASVFDSSRIRGVKLESDDAMLADSERGYAPVIRGSAEGNATVEVRQNGFVLYTTSVPAGPFALTNIFPSGSNGDLEVTVIEADGRRRVSTQAFSSLPLMVRKGRLKYSAAVGRYNGTASHSADKSLLDASAIYGIGDNLTGTAGTQLSDDFLALNVGVGTNTPIGAVSLDFTHSDSRRKEGSQRGQSMRMLYAKTFAYTKTNFTLAAYRYSTEGYRTLNDHMEERGHGIGRLYGARSRARLDLSVNQQLGGAGNRYGSLYLNISDQSYWQGATRTQSLSAGYGNAWRRLSYDANVSRTRNVIGSQDGVSVDDTQVMLSLSMPFGIEPRSPRASLSIRREDDGQYGTQAGLNGNLPGPYGAFYSLQGGRSSVGNTTGSASIGATLPVARVDGGYSQGSGYRSASVGAAGSMVVHAGGMNLGQSVGETFALAQVEGVEGVGIASYAGSRTGRNGYAVVPYAQPYRINQITIDTQSMGAEVEMEESIQQVVPRRGAIVKAKFSGRSGRRVQVQFLRTDGSRMPFGVSVRDEQGNQMTVTDPSGKALVLLSGDEGAMVLHWEGGSCTSRYLLGQKNVGLNFERIELMCQ